MNSTANEMNSQDGARSVYICKQSNSDNHSNLTRRTHLQGSVHLIE